MLLKDFVAGAREKLHGIYPQEEANSLVGVICTEYLGLQSYTHLVNPELELKGNSLDAAEAAMVRLLRGEPIQYVLGYADFYGRRFNVGPDVLVPRPETEVLCKQAIDAAMMIYRCRSVYGKNASPVRILDLCTGSGCIAWTLAAEIPGSEVVGLDVSDAALEVASSQKIEVPDGRKPVFIQADIFDDSAMTAMFGFHCHFDLLVSNPPYVLESEKSQMRSNVLDYEPGLALFVPDGDPQKFNRKIAEISEKYLDTGTTGIVEINDALDQAAMQVFLEKGFKSVKSVKDVSGRNRFIRFAK